MGGPFLDFITDFPKSEEYEVVLVVVDRFSKYDHFFLLKHHYTAKSIVELFVKEVERLHGIPNSIITDRDPIFVSHFGCNCLNCKEPSSR